MGLGGQMIAWEDDFCAQLAGRGFRVIRFDNRDVGLSTHLGAAGIVDAGAALMAALQGPIIAPYRLDDMAPDTIGLMDAGHRHGARGRRVDGRRDRADHAP